ncbi:MAG: DUF1848 domain-containing protein [Myxococcota bacterium]
MIISASYKTDIPAFYGRWFRNRLRAGYCKMVNPFNAHQVFEVSLRPEDVDGIVFWTKNPGPFLDGLADVHERGIPFIVQYTINGYPRVLESRVVPADKSIEHFRRIADTYGRLVPVWRYDTIVFSSETPPDFHRRNFERLASALEGATDEVVVSFAQIYKKTQRNMNEAAKEHGFTWSDPPASEKLALVRELAAMARARGIQLKVCSQKAYVVEGVQEARCVDAQRIMEVAGRLVASKLKGNRKECGCFYSKDIGDYDTCPHGCVYCYAVTSTAVAARRFREHDPEGEFLYPRVGAPPPETPSEPDQVPLFGRVKR